MLKVQYRSASWYCHPIPPCPHPEGLRWPFSRAGFGLIGSRDGSDPLVGVVSGSFSAALLLPLERRLGLIGPLLEPLAHSTVFPLGFLMSVIRPTSRSRRRPLSRRLNPLVHLSRCLCLSDLISCQVVAQQAVVGTLFGSAEGLLLLAAFLLLRVARHHLLLASATMKKVNVRILLPTSLRCYLL